MGLVHHSQLKDGDYAKFIQENILKIKRIEEEYPLNICIFGFSGAGKSSYLNSINTLLTAENPLDKELQYSSVSGSGLLPTSTYGFVRRGKVTLIDTHGFQYEKLDNIGKELDLSPVQVGESTWFDIKNFFSALLGFLPLKDVDCIAIMHQGGKEFIEGIMEEFQKRTVKTSKLYGIISHFDTKTNFNTENDAVREICSKYKLQDASTIANIDRNHVSEGIIHDFPIKYRHWLLKSYVGLLSQGVNNFKEISTPELVAKRIRNFPGNLISKL
jgi:energy-coupling factor transporter ATP-binding protein EcfA2